MGRVPTWGLRSSFWAHPPPGRKGSQEPCTCLETQFP